MIESIEQTAKGKIKDIYEQTLQSCTKYQEAIEGNDMLIIVIEQTR